MEVTAIRVDLIDAVARHRRVPAKRLRTVSGEGTPGGPSGPREETRPRILYGAPTEVVGT